MSIKGQIKLQIRVPRYCRLSLTPPEHLSNVFRRVIWAKHIHADCGKPASKCRCQMVRLSEDAS